MFWWICARPAAGCAVGNSQPRVQSELECLLHKAPETAFVYGASMVHPGQEKV